MALLDVDSRMKVRPTMDFFSDVVLAVTNWAYSQAAAVRLASWFLKKVQLPTSW
jgi:hypothetical protein